MGKKILQTKYPLITTYPLFSNPLSILENVQYTYAFEPSKMSFDTMKANIKRNNLKDVIIPVNVVLGKGNGEIFSQAKDEKEGPEHWCVIEDGIYPVDEISTDQRKRE